MVFRIYQLFICAVIFLLSLYNVNTFTVFERPQSQVTVKSFSWENCGPASDPIQVKSIDVAPDPVKIPGNLTIGFTSVESAAIPADTFIALTVEKKVAGFYIKVPCIDQFGSCNYTDICTVWKVICPKYFEKFGFPCTCPAPAGNYTLPDTVFDVTLKIPFAVGGPFRITANVGSSEYHVGCLQILVDLA